ncbi:MAG TPA: hypothetical protein ENG01_01130 [Candidatus Aenigmarchaeota archaeon]|nr:MAG: hypothetical protein DRN75_01015 [Nanoarchaeota archaeon]HDO79947.1 hypothetical protein [Candidatus Aenigmarchaeota archaeon]HEX32999.1 hypothetical protein [Candidatus Aenigmarchaeota archaeon]
MMSRLVPVKKLEESIEKGTLIAKLQSTSILDEEFMLTIAGYKVGNGRLVFDKPLRFKLEAYDGKLDAIRLLNWYTSIAKKIEHEHREALKLAENGYDIHYNHRTGEYYLQRGRKRVILGDKFSLDYDYARYLLGSQ